MCVCVLAMFPPREKRGACVAITARYRPSVFGDYMVVIYIYFVTVCIICFMLEL